MRKFQVHQKAARQASAQLKLMMGLAIVGTILLSSVVITYILAVLYTLQDNYPEAHARALEACFGVTLVVTALIVLIGTWWKQRQLRAGGRVIAEDLGGTLVERSAGAPHHLETQRLLNIVEEMSIAAGIATPPVYLLEGNSGINAFAAGFDPQTAVIGVTHGAVQHLKRDQLQGVIAHEFSHIFNGDMALNLKMVGWNHGILSISIVAEHLIYAGRALLESAYRRVGRNNPGGSIGLACLLILLGAALWPVGMIGTFFSLLVKAATSRQREFLADAYAVQYTRNPEGLAGAMRFIIGHQAGSRVRASKAIEASHLFFAEGCGSLASMLASHPPITHRILKLLPNWDGTPLFPEESDLPVYTGAFQGSMGLVAPLHGAPNGQSQKSQTSQPAHRQAGTPAAAEDDSNYSTKPLANEVFVSKIRQQLPGPLVKIAEAPEGAVLLTWGLWIMHSRHPQIAMELVPKTESSRLQSLLPVIRQLRESQHLLLLDTALENLPTGSDRHSVREVCSQFMRASEEGNIFHWMWATIVSRTLGLRENDPKIQYGQLDQVAGACEVLLSKVCHAGTDQEMMAGFSFQRGLASLGVDSIELVPADECTWQKFELAISVLAQLAAKPRRQVLLACSAALASDQEISPDESYLIRGICQKLGYETPSVLPGQPIAPGT